jgi:lysophospholipase L1-like esterase
MKKIVCFGDSVTLGIPYVHEHDTFVRILERRLNERRAQEERVVCVNAGVGGETSGEGLARIDASVLSKSPDIVCVEFGLNDIRYEPEKQVTLEQYAANLREIARRCAEAGAAVIFMTPNPVVDAFHGYSGATDYYDKWGGCNGAVIAYAQVMRQTAAEIGVPLCEVYGAFEALAVRREFEGACFDWRDLTCLAPYIRADDGVHLTPLGNDLIAGELYRAIVMGGMLGA